MHNPRIHNPMMHNLCINYIFACHKQTDVEDTTYIALKSWKFKLDNSNRVWFLETKWTSDKEP